MKAQSESKLTAKDALKLLADQRELIQDDIVTRLDGMDNKVIDELCQIVVDRFDILKTQFQPLKGINPEAIPEMVEMLKTCMNEFDCYDKQKETVELQSKINSLLLKAQL